MVVYKIIITFFESILPPFISPQGEAGALRNSLAGYFSEQAGLPRWLSLQAGSFAKPAHRAGSIRSALPWGKVGKGVIFLN